MIGFICCTFPELFPCILRITYEQPSKRGKTKMHTCTLCTSSTACESFWSASRMRSVSLWMMTSRGPCSSRGWLRSSYGQKDSHGSRVMLQTEQSNIHYKKNSYNISLQPIVTLSCKALPSCVINCF